MNTVIIWYSSTRYRGIAVGGTIPYTHGQDYFTFTFKSICHQGEYATEIIKLGCGLEA